ncbi:unnamed protein product [Clonostachys byssicola]|uniref:SAC3/GANP/THP3 conserved domain-containing protein n=1 Tax=Clonostachys byssicola TaxID=160290 RepID=A0A9N9Y9T8_9HYPO|nr:unnamed protein product [Clonostachys byssicola]
MISNPFSQSAQSQPAVSNPFAAAVAKPGKNELNPFGFGGAGDSAREKQNSKRKGGLTDQSDSHGSKRKGGKQSRDKDAAVSDSDASKRKRRDGNQKSAPKNSLPNGNAGAKKIQARKPRHENGSVAGNATDGSRPSSSSSQASNEIEGTTEPPKVPNTSDPHAKKVYTQLHSDGISPPNWPSRPGDPRNKSAMAKFRERYEGYRTKVRASLTKAGLIDDPTKRRALEDAIVFRGICEDMCPEYEKIQRITELDVLGPEKDPKDNVAATQRMVKKLARSAAGQEAPLPMDVRSVPALRRTLDYLIDDLLKNDKNLPGLHGFLWDRTRAIRRDFAFFSSLSPDELKTQVYVLENIARFHVTALHLLSQAGKKPEDFVEQQELEQLGKALLSLRDLYDDCNEQGITCENESEFRAYYLLFHAHDPNIMEVLQRQWSPHHWKKSDEVRTAVSLVEALQNTKDFHGPLKPAPALAAGGPLHSYFRIVEDQAVSYTMACFAECHFASLRRSMLIALVRALARPKDETRDVNAEALNRFLRFDTIDEAIEFAEAHGLEFEADPEAPNDAGRRRILLKPRQQVPHIRLQHQYSQKLVEQKRGSHTLPNVIHNTIFPSGHATVANGLETKSALTGSQPPINTASSTKPAISNGIPPPTAPSIFQAPAQAASSLSTGVGFTGFSAPSQPAPGFSFPKTQPPAANVLAHSKPSDTKPLFNPFASAFQPSSAPTGIAGAHPAATGVSQPAPVSGTPAFNPFANAVQAQPPADSAPPKFPSPSFQNPLAPTSTATPLTEVKTGSPPSVSGSVPSTLSGGQLAPGTPIQSTPAPLAPANGLLAPAVGQKPLSPLLKSSGFNFKPTDDASQKPLSTISEQKPEIPSQKADLFPSLQAAKPGTTQTADIPKPAIDAESALPGSSDVAKSLLGSTSASQQTLTAAPPLKPASPPPPPRDLMGDFAKWFVLGDKGLFEEFQTFVVEDLVKEVFDKFTKEEEEKKRREEEEAANAEADRWRIYNLRLKFFYRWKRNARSKRQRFLLRSGREQMREYWEAQKEAEREAKLEEERKKSKEKKELARKPDVDHAAELLSVVKKRRVSRAREEENLLSSGVLSGVTNEREAAARIVRHGSPASDVVFEKPARPSPSKAGVKEGAKSRALREQLLGNQPAGFRRSLPSSSVRSSASPTPPKNVSRVSERWRLKAMGFVQMPDGSVLPESIADEVLASGKRFWTGARASSYNQSALNVSRAHASSVSRPRASSYSTPNHNDPTSASHASGHLTPTTPQADHEISHIKRKRSFNDDDELSIPDAEQSRPHKRTVSDLVDIASKVRSQHQELKAMLDDMMGDDLSEQLQSEINSRGTTPWQERF